ncbi:helix-turn-helix domain-containing protein [Haloarchaeobius sp. HRN-SO-5]|uniref:helix-turn-helix domain-containing protein n=1 Tax=Haloarchaeobius sp. HRN-SO-5 TaxID=3446118 RepID=UPI003EB78F29
MREELPPSELFELLADEYARAILIATADRRMSAPMLADHIDAANSTVYDRIDRLLDAGLLDGRDRISDDGDHYTAYSARLEGMAARLTADGFTVETEVIDRDAQADRLTDLWEGLR